MDPVDNNIKFALSIKDPNVVFYKYNYQEQNNNYFSNSDFCGNLLLNVLLSCFVKLSNSAILTF